MSRTAPRPLRVLLLNERCPSNPLAGGAEVHLFEIFSRLIGPRLSVELLCSGFPGAAPTDSQRGIAITRLGTRLSYYGRLVGEVRRRVAAGSVDLIVEALNKIPFLTPLWAHVPVMAIHHHLHGLTAFRQVNPALALGSVAIEQLVPLAYRHVPLVTISRSSKVELVRRGLPEEHIDVVPCSIDHVLHRPAELRGRPPEVVCLGRLEPYKRLDLALAAFRAVVDQVPAARLHLVGRGQDEDRLKALTRRLGLVDHVAFHGFVDEATKVALLQRCALLLQCSRKEGWGLTVVEAYACGTPVVATAVPGLTDSVQDGLTGLLVDKPRPATVAATIVKLLRDEPRRVQMAEYALACAARFDWDAAARDVGAVLGRLAPAPQPPLRLPRLPAEAPA